MFRGLKVPQQRDVLPSYVLPAGLPLPWMITANSLEKPNS
jgi:hypothetical protein